MENIPDSLTDEQKKYLKNLRHGIIEDGKSIVRSKLTPESQQDFANLKQFLNDHGHPDPQPRDLFLPVERQSVLRLLEYVEANDCLGLQYCFGLNKYINEGGQMQFINGAGMWQKSIWTSDEEVFRSNFEREDEEGNKYFERFLNFNSSILLRDQEVKQYTANFQAIYTERRLNLDHFLLGSLLPVKRLKKIFTDPSHPLGITDILTFRWGLTAYRTNGELGNFTLVIGMGDVTAGPVIEFRSEELKGAHSEGDCPPRPPCRSDE